MRVRIRAWNSVERDSPLAFSTMKKAEKYCNREIRTWDSCTLNGLVRTGETIEGNFTTQQSLVIVPTTVDERPGIWRVVVRHGDLESVSATELKKAAAMKYVTKIAYNLQPSGWHMARGDPSHLKHKGTGMSVSAEYIQ